MFGYEPRSGDYYGDDDYDGGSRTWDWHDILWFPVVILIMFLFEIAPFLLLAGYFLQNLYSTLKKTTASGELVYPFLAKVGVVVAVILIIVNYSRPENVPLHLSFPLALAVGFLIIFTVLPILALSLHSLIKFRSFIKTKLDCIKMNRRK